MAEPLESVGDRTSYRTTIGSQTVDLPLVHIGDGPTIALMITVDMPISFMRTAGRELAELIAPSKPDVVVTAATMGIPVGEHVAANLGMDEYVVLQKTNKWHLRNALSEQLTSITSQSTQTLKLDPSRQHLIEGARVAFVDDVLSTGASALASLRLLERAGGEIVSVGCLLTESDGWHTALGAHAEKVVSLGHIPIFHN